MVEAPEQRSLLGGVHAGTLPIDDRRVEPVADAPHIVDEPADAAFVAQLAPQPRRVRIERARAR
jgi:hypothetical protein